jgi:hypothetical protein
MANVSLSLYTNGFFGSVLKSLTQMGSLSINKSVTNISRQSTFKEDNAKIFVRLQVKSKYPAAFYLGLGTEFRSEKIPRNRLGMVSVIPRKKVPIPRHSEFRGRANFEARNGTERSGIPRKNGVLRNSLNTEQNDFNQGGGSELLTGGFSDFFMYVLSSTCFICRPSDSTVSEDAGIEPRTVSTSALAVRHSIATRHISSTLGYISSTLGYISSTLGYISSTLGYISSTLGYISFTLFFFSLPRNGSERNSESLLLF